MARGRKFSRAEAARGGKAAAAGMTAKQRQARARKAAYMRSLRRLLGIPK